MGLKLNRRSLFAWIASLFATGPLAHFKQPSALPNVVPCHALTDPTSWFIQKPQTLLVHPNLYKRVMEIMNEHQST